MAILYGVGLAMTLLIGGLIGQFVTSLHYQAIAAQHREYEKEITEGRDYYAALAMLRHIEPVKPADDKAPAA